jgi:hypothetical protein
MWSFVLDSTDWLGFNAEVDTVMNLWVLWKQGVTVKTSRHVLYHLDRDSPHRNCFLNLESGLFQNTVPTWIATLLAPCCHCDLWSHTCSCKLSMDSFGMRDLALQFGLLFVTWTLSICLSCLQFLNSLYSVRQLIKFRVNYEFDLCLTVEIDPILEAKLT